jgi:transketolase
MGWLTREIDGHSLSEVVAALRWAIAAGTPACIVAHTFKGKGVSFMEGENAYHGVAPTDDELARALAELEGEDPEEQLAHALGEPAVHEQAVASIDAEAAQAGVR